MTRSMLVERRTIAVSGVWLFLVLVLGTLLAGCSSGFEEKGDLSVPLSPEEAGEVVIRVSGTEGIVYSGTYGTIEGMLETAEDTLGSEPTEYEVEVAEGVADGVTAGFQKTQPGEGELQVEILADDEVVVESRTLADLGAVNADWFPQVDVPKILPGENKESLPGEEVAPEESP
ncbi:MAG TPA: hypothetical protein VK359_09095 [Rubrobacteraceae bacterium]|nr:hypothetical protein [Rubrobacteraceae bacterium]